MSNAFSNTFFLYRGRVRNFNLRVPLLNRWFTLERVPLNESQNFAGSAEPVEPVLTRPLGCKTRARAAARRRAHFEAKATMTVAGVRCQEQQSDSYISTA